VVFQAASAAKKVASGFLKEGAFDSAKNHKRQRRKRQSVTAKVRIG